MKYGVQRAFRLVNASVCWKSSTPQLHGNGSSCTEDPSRSYPIYPFIWLFICILYNILYYVYMEKAMAPHSSTLAWKIPWMEEPGGLLSMGSLRVRHNWATSLSLFTFMHWRRKWQPTPVFLPGESQGRGSLTGCHLRGQSRTQLKRFSNYVYKPVKVGKWFPLLLYFCEHYSKLLNLRRRVVETTHL